MLLSKCFGSQQEEPPANTPEVREDHTPEIELSEAERMEYVQLLPSLVSEGSLVMKERLRSRGLPPGVATDIVADFILTIVRARLDTGPAADMDLSTLKNCYECIMDKDGEVVEVRAAQPPQVNSCAAAPQLFEAEAQLNITFPRLFHRLYTEIGEGGYGPGYGLLELDEMLDEYGDHVQTYGRRWPVGLLMIATEGCLCRYYLDCRHPQYRVVMFDSDYAAIEDDMLPIADSFDDWIAHWANPDWAHERFLALKNER
jgi:hypothetical protein